MIKLEMDEAYVFDFLSVLDIKQQNSKKDENNFNVISHQIKDQIGDDLYNRIIKSEIYLNLIKTNKIIYDLIDLMRQTKQYLDARVIDGVNTQRYLMKRRLQSEFFDTELTENKNI